MKTSLAATISLLVLSSFGIFSFAHQHGSPGDAHLIYSNGTLHAHTHWLVGPEVNKEAKLLLDFKNGADHSVAVPNATIKVIPWMPAHGHGTRPTTVAPLYDQQSKVIEGSFMTSQIYLTMPGTWEIRVELTYADGTKEMKSFNVDLAGQHGGHKH